MNKTAVFFASASGKTRRFVEQFVMEWGDPIETFELLQSSRNDLLKFDTVFFGSPTYGMGELHHHWPPFLEKLIEKDLSGKRLGLFVMADGRYHGDTFAGALGHLFDAVKDLGGDVSGFVSPKDYIYNETNSLRGGQFPGLVIDGSTPQQRRMTKTRLTNWLSNFK